VVYYLIHHAFAELFLSGLLLRFADGRTAIDFSFTFEPPGQIQPEQF
jgi:hypothetical protein